MCVLCALKGGDFVVRDVKLESTFLHHAVVGGGTAGIGANSVEGQ